MKVRPAALKNEEAKKAREQHANEGALGAPAGYRVMLLHVFYYYAFAPWLSTWSRSSAALPTARGLRCTPNGPGTPLRSLGHVRAQNSEHAQRMRPMNLGYGRFG